MHARTAIPLCLYLIALTSCAHPNRVSRGTLQRLTKSRDAFVLVFGSVSTPKGILDRPAIRFVHQANRSAPEYLLYSLVISSGDRFYAVLKVPSELPYLDEFYAEVGSADTGFDRIDYVRLRRGDAPLAMYVGEIRMSPAQTRTAQGQKIVVSINDDFNNAVQELKRLYPRFDGTIAKAALLRNPVPMPTPPRRVN
jgi:hypothetical protein